MERSDSQGSERNSSYVGLSKKVCSSSLKKGIPIVYWALNKSSNRKVSRLPAWKEKRGRCSTVATHTSLFQFLISRQVTKWLVAFLRPYSVHLSLSCGRTRTTEILLTSHSFELALLEMWKNSLAAVWHQSHRFFIKWLSTVETCEH